MPEQSKFSILVNELNRRFEVMSDEVTIQEIIGVIDKFTQQLVNSGYGFEQVREIVVSCLKGQNTKKLKRKTIGGKKYLSSKETLEDRIKKKLT